MDEIVDIWRSVSEYHEISKELDYVIAEAGMDGQTEVNFDEFIEVRFISSCSSLAYTTWSDDLVLL